MNKDGYELWATSTKSIIIKEPKQPFPKLEDYYDSTLAARMELQCKINDHKERKGTQESTTQRIRKGNIFPFFIFGAIN